mmetsp:Transcript_36968/g.59564  ORF Transcript_36968/g.59564 Transcript_36968/m.59564 type:complete len:214 (-) Transcript_36968:224-865(-)
MLYCNLHLRTWVDRVRIGKDLCVNTGRLHHPRLRHHGLFDLRWLRLYRHGIGTHGLLVHTFGHDGAHRTCVCGKHLRRERWRLRHGFRHGRFPSRLCLCLCLCLWLYLWLRSSLGGDHRASDWLGFSQRLFRLEHLERGLFALGELRADFPTRVLYGSHGSVDCCEKHLVGMRHSLLFCSKFFYPPCRELAASRCAALATGSEQSHCGHTQNS